MPTRFAIASGNWTDPSIWDNGSVPLSGDTVFANGNTITFNQDVTALSLYTSAASSYVLLPDNAIPAINSNSSVIGSAISNSPSNSAFQAFNQDGSSSWWSSSIANTGWLGFQFNTQKVIKKYAFWGYNDARNAPYSWTFEGSNDGTNWTVLDTRSLIATTNVWVNYAISNTTAYYYYRLNISTVVTVAGFSPVIYELNMTESSSSALGNVTGGTFQLPGNRTINILSGIYAGGNHCVSYIGNSGETSYINTSIINGYAGTSTTLFCINHTGSGTLYITSTDCIAGPFSCGTIQVNNVSATCNINIKNIGSTNNSNGANVNLNAYNTVNIIGNLYGHNTGNYSIPAVYVRGNGTVNITGNLSGGSQWNGGSRGAVEMYTGSGTVNITGTVTSNNLSGGGSCAVCIYSGYTVNIVGDIYSGATYFPSVYSTVSNSTVDVTGKIYAGGHNGLLNGGTSILSGPLINNGTLAAYQGRICYLKDMPIRWKINRSDGTTDNSMYSADYAPNYPDMKDVRNGISYNGGLMTGTMKVPNEQNVQKSFVYDGGRVGTGMLTTTDISNAVWSYLISNISTDGSIGYRLKDVSTVDNLGKQIEGFNGL